MQDAATYCGARVVHRGPRHHRLAGDTMPCPADVRVAVQRSRSDGIANFGTHSASCPLANRRTSSPSGRTIPIGPHEEMLTRATGSRQLACRLPFDSAQSRAQTRPSDAPSARRAAVPGPGQSRGERRFQPAGSRHQPGPVGGAGAALSTGGLGGGERVSVAQEPAAGHQQRTSGPAAPPRPTAPPDPPSPLRCAAAVAVVTALLGDAPARRFRPAT